MIMEWRFTGLIAALTFILIGSGIAQERPYLPDPSSIPSEISAFYEDYNFVTSFSTPSERDMLIDCFSRDVLPKRIRSERMNHVFRMMKKLYSRMTRTDPDMVLHLGPRQSYVKYFFRSELLDLKKLKRSGKKAVVEISAYAVEPGFVERFIQQYEKNQDDEETPPPTEERIRSVKGRIVPQTEFHIWLYQNGKWMKAEYKNIYVKR